MTAKPFARYATGPETRHLCLPQPRLHWQPPLLLGVLFRIDLIDMENEIVQPPLPKTNEQGHLCARPDGEAGRIMTRLRKQTDQKSKSEPHVSLPIDQLSPEEMKVLNEFASRVAESKDC